MAKYRKKSVIVEAVQWFKNGDHPLDYSFGPNGISPEERKARGEEGDVVHYYRFSDDDTDSHRVCPFCRHTMHEHGYVYTQKGGVVCPGDWIVTDVNGCRHPVKPDDFAATYEPVED